MVLVCEPDHEFYFMHVVESRGPHHGVPDACRYHLLGKRDILGEVGRVVFERRDGGEAVFDDLSPVLEDVVVELRTLFPGLTVADCAEWGSGSLGGDEVDFLGAGSIFLGAGSICGNSIGFTFQPWSTQRWSNPRFRSHDVVIADVVMDGLAGVVIEGLADVACTGLMMLMVLGKNENDVNFAFVPSYCSPF